MLTAEEYLEVVGQRIQRTGGQLRHVQMGQVNAVVGLFTENVMLSAMNYAIVAAPAAPTPHVTGLALQQFNGIAVQIARANMVGVVGWTAASVTISGLIGEHVTPDGMQMALAKPANQFGAENRLVAVDLTAGAVHTFTGTRVWGAAIQGSINAKITFCFPPLAEAWHEAQALKQQRGMQPSGPQQLMPGAPGQPGGPGGHGGPQPAQVSYGAPGAAPPNRPAGPPANRPAAPNAARPQQPPAPAPRPQAQRPTPPPPPPTDDRTQVVSGKQATGAQDDDGADRTQVLTGKQASDGAKIDADATQVVSNADADATRVVPKGQTS